MTNTLPSQSHVRLDPVPDAARIRLIDELSYTFVDQFGKEHVQSIREFTAENRPYFDVDGPRSRNELKAVSVLQRKKQVAFQFMQMPTRVVWNEFQTDIRNQLDRNTCSGFAMVAAIEARYMRDYDLRLDLSVQFFWHCYKSTGLSHPKVYNYKNQSSFWGGGNSHGLRTTVNFAIPLEQHCPYLGRVGILAVRDQIPTAGTLDWNECPTLNVVTQDEVDAFEYSPLYISDEARQQAKYGVKSYAILDQSTVRNLDVLERYLTWGYEVIVDAELKWTIDPETGIRNYKPDSEGGLHAFLIVGFDRDEQAFYIKNSWGEDGLIRVSYEFAENCFNRGSIVAEVTDPEKPAAKARAIGLWQMNHDGWKGELILRRFTNEDNDVTRLGHYRSGDGSLNAINGRFVRGGRGVQFSFADGADADPTSLTGQAFSMDVFSGDIKHAAGDTTWSNVRFGAYMCRNAIPSSYGKDFQPAKWKGTWSINHDGWKGELVITRVFPIPFAGWLVQGEYQPPNGPRQSIVGFLDGLHTHILQLNIHFTEVNSQFFVLHFHTWSSDLASGFTFWNGSRFGAVAFKH